MFVMNSQCVPIFIRLTTEKRSYMMVTLWRKCGTQYIFLERLFHLIVEALWCVSVLPFWSVEFVRVCLMKRIESLPESVHSSMRSGVVICDLTRIVEELVLNSIDAGATKVRCSWNFFMLSLVIWFLIGCLIFKCGVSEKKKKFICLSFDNAHKVNEVFHYISIAGFKMVMVVFRAIILSICAGIKKF